MVRANRLEQDTGMLNRSKFWAVSLLLTVFVSGVAVGGPVWNTIYDRGTPGGGRRGGPPESREHGRRSFAEHLQGDLNLSTAQRTAVDSILAESQDAMTRAMMDLAESAELRGELGCAARASAVDSYNHEVLGDRLTEFVRRFE